MLKSLCRNINLTFFPFQLGSAHEQTIFYVAIIALMPGCFSKQKKSEKRPVNKQEVMTDVDIPVAEGSVKNFFDQDLDEMDLAHQPMAADTDHSQYAWIEQGKSANGFKKVYFDFDKYAIKSTEKEAVEQDVARMQEVLAQAEKDGKEVQFVINGNADHYAGSDAYNHLLSEKRAKTLKDQAVAAGVPSEKIKIVGRGSDFPEIINGKPSTGNKDQQAPNRRDEIQMLKA